MSPRLRLPPRAGWLVLVTALVLSPAAAPADTEPGTLHIESPRSGDIETTVTGRGAAASVAVPDAPAAMTPRWIVSGTRIDWTCPDSNAVKLVVRTGRGPSATPHTFDLRPYTVHGASSELDLYLWEVSAVKAACTRDGEARVDSVPVKLTLRCENGQEMKHTQVLALQAHCRPSAPSEEAVTGLTGTEDRREQGLMSTSLDKFSQKTIDPDPLELSLGREGTVEFSNVPRQTRPEIQSLRVVRLGAGDKVVQRYPPARLSDDPERSWFEPRLTLTPRSAGPLRFALEAEYPDGSRLLSKPAELQVLTAAQEAAQKAAQEARRVAPEQRMAFLDELMKRMGDSGCGQALVDWMKAQPVIQDAGNLQVNLWYRFTDGLSGIVSCH
jgi:hypothetical protein